MESEECSCKVFYENDLLSQNVFWKMIEFRRVNLFEMNLQYVSPFYFLAQLCTYTNEFAKIVVLQMGDEPTIDCGWHHHGAFQFTWYWKCFFDSSISTLHGAYSLACSVN